MVKTFVDFFEDGKMGSHNHRVEGRIALNFYKAILLRLPKRRGIVPFNMSANFPTKD